jgi:beta-phosphoglucomutase-like phosphatase (HAD superfamily)
MRIEPAFLFDLDGTLVDSVYQHVLAWKEALDAEGIELSVWRIHRKIGMSGGLFTNQLLRETGIKRVERLRQAHAAAYRMQTGLGCENRAGRVISSSRASGGASKRRAKRSRSRPSWPPLSSCSSQPPRYT